MTSTDTRPDGHSPYSGRVFAAASRRAPPRRPCPADAAPDVACCATPHMPLVTEQRMTPASAFPDVSISTERLMLRAYEEADIPALVEMMNDDLVTAWTGVPRPYTEAD